MSSPGTSNSYVSKSILASYGRETVDVKINSWFGDKDCEFKPFRFEPLLLELSCN